MHTGFSTASCNHLTANAVSTGPLLLAETPGSS